jgi:hypothetical protein
MFLSNWNKFVMIGWDESQNENSLCYQIIVLVEYFDIYSSA